MLVSTEAYVLLATNSMNVARCNAAALVMKMGMKVVMKVATKRRYTESLMLV